MKQVFVFTILFCFFNARLWAQVPQSFQYQAIARDKDQKPLAGATLEVEVKILRNGTEVFSETHGDVKTAPTGLFVLAVGSKEPADFSTINWALSGYSLKVSTTGALVLDLPPSPILSVPYALMAEEVRTEKQQLTLSNGNVLSITGGNSVTLPTGGQNLQAGQGIGISNNTINNLGDLDSNNDVLKTDQAGGKLSGVFSDLQIKTGAVGNAELANGSVSGSKIAQQGAVQGQVLKWNGTTWAPENDQSTVGSGNAATSSPLSGDGSASKPIALQPGNTNGQVLKWDGSKWAAGVDEVGSIGTIGGDLIGPLNDLQLKAGAIEINDLGSMGATQSGQILKWNNITKKWELGNDITVGGTAKGDVSGIFDNKLLVVGIQDRPVNAIAPALGQVLKWNGNAWQPDNDQTGSGGGANYSAGPGIGITGNAPNLTINNTGVLKTDQAVGDVTGLFSNLSLDKIKGRTISNSPPQNGQVLKWNSTTMVWAPSDDLNSGTGGNNYTAGTGINITGTPPNLTINNIGVLKTEPAGGDLGTSTYGNLQIAQNAVGNLEIADNAVTISKIADNAVGTNEIVNAAVTADKLAPMGATTPNQILRWNGSVWGASNENAGSSPWVSDPTGIHYPNAVNGTVRINSVNSATNKLVEIGPANKTVPVQFASLYSNVAGSLATYGPNGNSNVLIGHLINASNNQPLPNHGAIAVHGSDGYRTTPPALIGTQENNSGFLYLSNKTGKEVVATGANTDDTGFLSALNANQKPNVDITTLSGFPNQGAISVLGSDGRRQYPPGLLYSFGDNSGGMYLSNSNGNVSFNAGASNNNNCGYLELFNANDKINVSLGNYVGFPNNGYVGVFDASANPRAGAFVDQDGKGYVFGDDAAFNVKNFRMAHPRDTSKEIWYACIEGPEAAAYERGTGTLTNGEAWVPFSEHFHEVVNSSTMTVTLTPLSSETDGLAVVEKTATGIRVRELRGGKGNFSFDWEVKGVRKGYENYQAVRPRKDWPVPPHRQPPAGRSAHK